MNSLGNVKNLKELSYLYTNVDNLSDLGLKNKKDLLEIGNMFDSKIKKVSKEIEELGLELIEKSGKELSDKNKVKLNTAFGKLEYKKALEKFRNEIFDLKDLFIDYFGIKKKLEPSEKEREKIDKQRKKLTLEIKELKKSILSEEKKDEINTLELELSGIIINLKSIEKEIELLETDYGLNEEQIAEKRKESYDLSDKSFELQTKIRTCYKAYYKADGFEGIEDEVSLLSDKKYNLYTSGEKIREDNYSLKKELREVKKEIDEKLKIEHKKITKNYLKYGYSTNGFLDSKGLKYLPEYKNIQRISVDFGENGYLEKTFKIEVKGYIEDGDNKIVVIHGDVYDLVGKIEKEEFTTSLKEISYNEKGKKEILSKKNGTVEIEVGNVKLEYSKKYTIKKSNGKLVIKKYSEKEISENDKKIKIQEKEWEEEEEKAIGETNLKFEKIIDALEKGEGIYKDYRDMGKSLDYNLNFDEIIETDSFNNMNVKNKKEFVLGYISDKTKEWLMEETLEKLSELDYYSKIIEILEENEQKEKNME